MAVSVTTGSAEVVSILLLAPAREAFLLSGKGVVTVVTGR